MDKKLWLEELPANYQVRFLVQEHGIFHSLNRPCSMDELEENWLGNAIFDQFVQIGELPALSEQNLHNNLYRSWQVYDQEMTVMGRFPAYIDIDSDNVRNPNFTEAYEATSLLIKKLCDDHQENDLRIIFSGQKGFHIEIREWLNQSNAKVYDEMIGNFRAEISLIDRPKEYLRLIDTINSTDTGAPNRMCFAMSLNEFENKTVDEILRCSTQLAERATASFSSRQDSD